VAEPTCELWAEASDLPETTQAAISGLDLAVVQAILHVATGQLYALSGRRWRGSCTRTVTLTSDCGGTEQGAVRLRTGPPAARPWTSLLQLPDDWPITTVTEVRDWDGTPIAPDRYRLVNGRSLEALDPATGRPTGWAWPEVTVTYTHGALPPEGGRQAAAILASELLLARAGSGACRLPERVQSITRQGVSIAVLDPMDFLDRGRTGLVEVDAWLTSVNPARARARPVVWSPDTSRTRTRSHPTGG
jgi:hypothetical protein